jgi:hypothetical protein
MRREPSGRFLVALAALRDLLIGAKHLFFAAMVAIASAAGVKNEQWDLFGPEF